MVVMSTPKDEKHIHHAEADVCRVTGKVAHDEYFTAARQVRRLVRNSRQNADDFNIYVCEHCGKYHVGHKWSYS